MSTDPRQPTNKATTTKATVPCAYDNLGILDFEATCAENDEHETWNSALQEIIELPLTLVRVATGEVIDRFVTVVRPTLQPVLTQFCRDLTHISQAEVEAAPEVELAFEALNRWLESHHVSADNTLLVTCGDWDLKKMWPRQVSLAPALWTPRLFQRWCNLKVVYSEHTGRRATDMLGMLEALELPHHGQHHRGADDVVNLTRIVQRLLREGATFCGTWNDANRQAELDYWRSKSKKAKLTIEHLERALARLPATAPEATRTQAQERLEQSRVHAFRMARTVRVFEMPTAD